MVRPLRNCHRIIWIILAIVLPIGIVIAFIFSRKFDAYYKKKNEQKATSESIADNNPITYL